MNARGELGARDEELLAGLLPDRHRVLGVVAGLVVAAPQRFHRRHPHQLPARREAELDGQSVALLGGRERQVELAVEQELPGLTPERQRENARARPAIGRIA